MVEGIVIGVAVFVITAVLARITGLFKVAKNVQAWEVEVYRAGKDYLAWRQRADREFAERVRGIDEDFNARNIYHSGDRLAARAQVVEEMQLRTIEEVGKASRRIEDAFHELRRVDIAWQAIKYRKGKSPRYGIIKAIWIAFTKQPKSLEKDILDPVVRDLRGETDPPA